MVLSHMEQTTVCPNNNEQVFDATVRELLTLGRVENLGQSTELLLQTILHGEGSEVTALNLIIHAHVAHILVDVWSPFEKDEWTMLLEENKSQFRNGLQVCHKMFATAPTTEDLSSIQEPNGWTQIIPEEYGLATWDNITNQDFFSKSFNVSTLIDRITEILISSPDCSSNHLFSVTEHFGLMVTTWRQLFIADVIQKSVESNTDLEFDRWKNLVDLCARLIRQSDSNGEAYMLAGAWEVDSRQVDTTEIGFIDVPALSKEFWAWQFGRAAALARDIDYPEFGDSDDAFSGWENGVIALSLLIGAGKPPDWAGRWTGAILTCDQVNQDENDLRVTSHLFWLMQIGVLNVVKQSTSRDSQLNREPNSVETLLVEKPGSDALLLGSYSQLGEAIVAAQESVRKAHLDELTAGLKEQMSPVWEELSADSQEHIIQGEMSVENHKLKEASLHFSNSVEAALLDWFPKPKGVKWWPDRFGEWTLMLRELTGNIPRAHRAAAFKGRIDPQYAGRLLEALELFQSARFAGAHAGERLPSARKAQQLVLGVNQPSVFELALRFAQRWRW